MMRVGLLGMRRRIFTYDPAQELDFTHLLITVAGFMVGLSMLIFIINIVRTFARRGCDRQCLGFALAGMGFASIARAGTQLRPTLHRRRRAVRLRSARLDVRDRTGHRRARAGRIGLAK